jgi:hypothetical protein
MAGSGKHPRLSAARDVALSVVAAIIMNHEMFVRHGQLLGLPAPDPFWGVHAKGEAATWVYRVMEATADAGEPRGALVPMDDGYWLPAPSKQDAELIRRTLTGMCEVPPALAEVITIDAADRRGMRPEDTVRVR